MVERCSLAFLNPVASLTIDGDQVCRRCVCVLFILQHSTDTQGEVFVFVQVFTGGCMPLLNTSHKCQHAWHDIAWHVWSLCIFYSFRQCWCNNWLKVAGMPHPETKCGVLSPIGDVKCRVDNIGCYGLSHWLYMCIIIGVKSDCYVNTVNIYVTMTTAVKSFCFFLSWLMLCVFVSPWRLLWNGSACLYHHDVHCGNTQCTSVPVLILCPDRLSFYHSDGCYDACLFHHGNDHLTQTLTVTASSATGRLPAATCLLSATTTTPCRRRSSQTLNCWCLSVTLPWATLSCSLSNFWSSSLCWMGYSVCFFSVTGSYCHRYLCTNAPLTFLCLCTCVCYLDQPHSPTHQSVYVHPSLLKELPVSW